MDEKDQANVWAQGALNIAKHKAGGAGQRDDHWRIGEDLLDRSTILPEELKADAKAALYRMLFPEHDIEA